MIRVGFGIDIHRFTKGRKLVLGGIRVPFHKGLAGHSDADAVVHAVIDALLGAAALGDIGEHFPDTDKRTKNKSSLEFLRRTRTLLNRKGFSPVNIDVTILTDVPRMSPYKKKMQATMARSLQMPSSSINVKATRTEGLSLARKGNGLVVYSIATIKKKK